MKKYRVEFGELKLGETSKKHLLECHATNWASGGPKVAEFEKKWGEIFNYQHNVAVSSGTDAGINACMALYDFGAGRGDEVIVPALSFIATSNAVLAAGLTPVFVDVEKETLNIDPGKIEEKITPKTRAVKVVNTMGKPCEMDSIRDICDRHKLMLIVDGCESHGCQYKGKYDAHWGDMATYSFYVAHLICCGEGGMVSTNRADVADVLKSTRSHGRKNGDLYFDHVRFGLNSKMNDLEASLGLEGIENFWWTFDTRKKNLYTIMEATECLKEYAWMNVEEDHEVVCPHAFTFTLKDPKHDVKALSNYLDDAGIKVKRNFGCIPTQHGAFKWMGYSLGDFPEAEHVGNHGIHFGVHQYLTEDDMLYAAEVLKKYFKRHG